MNLKNFYKRILEWFKYRRDKELKFLKKAHKVKKNISPFLAHKAFKELSYVNTGNINDINILLENAISASKQEDYSWVKSFYEKNFLTKSNVPYHEYFTVLTDEGEFKKLDAKKEWEQLLRLYKELYKKRIELKTTATEKPDNYYYEGILTMVLNVSEKTIKEITLIETMYKNK